MDRGDEAIHAQDARMVPDDATLGQCGIAGAAPVSPSVDISPTIEANDRRLAWLLPSMKLTCSSNIADPGFPSGNRGPEPA